MTSYVEQRANQLLDAHLHQLNVESFLPRNEGALERREKPRFTQAFLARVWGIDAEGDALSLDCVIDNISASGLHLTLPRKIKPLSEISLAVRVLKATTEVVTAAVRGIVIRTDLQPDGRYGIAVSTAKCTFL
jgi:hypothetical protein